MIQSHFNTFNMCRILSLYEYAILNESNDINLELFATVWF